MKYFYVDFAKVVSGKLDAAVQYGNTDEQPQIYHIDNEYAKWLYNLAADCRSIDFPEVDEAFTNGDVVIAGTGPKVAVWGQDNITDKKIFADLLNGTLIKVEMEVDEHA